VFFNYPGFPLTSGTCDFVPKRLSLYKIPGHFKEEVEQQLQDLLALSIIRPSKSPMANPVVCVLKGKDGKVGVRPAIDYRHVNKYTVPDAYPSPDISDIIQTVGKASHISTFDATKGYYNTPVKEEDRWLTAFICEFGYLNSLIPLSGCAQVAVPL